MENLDQLKSILDTPKKIFITSHRNPDGDAIGSSLGLYHFLVKKGHSVEIAFPSEYPQSFCWMPHVDQIYIYDLKPEPTLKALEEADVVFCLDFNALGRIDKMGAKLREMDEVTTVMIDHHIDPEPFPDFMLSEVSASSTSELVYDFILALGEDELLDVQICNCLYTGIVTDTGSFKYGTSPKLFRTMAKILEKGVDDRMLQDLIFNSLPEKQLRLLGHCLINRMHIFEEYSTGLITLSRRDYERFNIQRGDTEGIVNYILRIGHMKMAAFITEQPNIVKVSLRSKGSFSVQRIATEHFNGGGHRNAAGGYSHVGLRKTVERFKEILPDYAEELNAPTNSVNN